MKEYSVIIAAFLTGVAGPLLLAWVRSLLEKKPGDMLTEAIELGNMVEDKLDSIKDDYKADRVWIAQFHNGAHFYPTGKSIAKFSIMYETVNVEVSSIQSKFQNIPVNLFGKACNQLLANNAIAIYDYADKDIQSFGLGYFFDEHSCKSSYIFAIKTIDEKFIGFMGLDYAWATRKLTDAEIVDLEIQASSIGGVLMNHLNK